MQIILSKWLEGFAYHIRIHWVVLVLASLGALIVAWLTISYESVKAALANPAGSLRSE